MGAKLEPVFDGTNAMLVERRRFVGTLRQIIVGLLLRPHQASVEEVNLLIEHTRVSDTGDIATRDVREPQIVVGEMRADAATRRWMPPMLDVAFAELMSGRAKQMLTREGRFRMHQR